MRQLTVKVPRGRGRDVMDIARQHEGVNLSQLNSQDGDKSWDLVIIHVANYSAGDLISAVEEIPDRQMTLYSGEVFPMSPPPSAVSNQITDVEPRSPLEVWLNGLQSIGSWKGFIGYTVAASVVAWIGMFTNTIYLLIAAMLIAPFAGPAMNVAIATASGDRTLLSRNLIRYGTSIGLTVLVTTLLSLIMGLEIATNTMTDVSKVSTVTVLLPLVTGAAGALNLIQAQNDNLVSGTAVGLLVAASLAPPAGLTGMAIALGRWDMVVNALFLLSLQLVGINLAGSLVFRLYGLEPIGARYQHGESTIFYGSLAITTVLLIGLLIWQFSGSLNLQRSSLEERSVTQVEAVLSESGLASLVEANVRFTRPQAENRRPTLLGVIYVQPQPNVTAPTEEISQKLTRAIQQRLNAKYEVTPLISVVVLESLEQK